MPTAFLHKKTSSWHIQLRLSVLALCMALAMAVPGAATAADSDSSTVEPRIPSSVTSELRAGLPEFFKICHDQTFAQCGVLPAMSLIRSLTASVMF